LIHKVQRQEIKAKKTKRDEKKECTKRKRDQTMLKLGKSSCKAETEGRQKKRTPSGHSKNKETETRNKEHHMRLFS
jgi:TFIIF-interacting CTD phosphatase-like protein